MAGRYNLDTKAIVDKEFSIEFKGYSPDQVDQMLDLVIQDYETYQQQIDSLSSQIRDLEQTNASLRAKLIEVEGRLKAQEGSADVITAAGSNVDILKRLSRLEAQVFNDKQNKQ